MTSDHTQYRSLWEADGSGPPPYPELTAPVTAETVVIGAGYTGLSTALHLGAAGHDVVVIDAAEPGWGASGRNGGQVIAGLKHDPDSLEAMFGAETGARLVQAVASGPDLVFSLIEKYGITCDAQRAGWIQAAYCDGDLAAIGSRVQQWRRRGAPVQALDRTQIAAFIGSDLYRGGWIDRRGGTVQPLLYARGLAAAAASVGARLYARTPALGLEHGDGWQVRTARGTVRARHVVLATNAYTDALHDGLRRSVVAVPSFQIATEPLPREVRGSILPGGQAVSDTRRLLRYFRTDASGRVVMGSRGSFRQRPPEQARRAHVAAVEEIFPGLRGVRYDYHWSGLVAMTDDHLPHLHELGPRLYAALGCNGRGVALATALGRVLALRVLGHAPEELDFPISALRPIRLHRLSRIGVHIMIQYLRVRDRLSRLRRGRHPHRERSA